MTISPDSPAHDDYLIDTNGWRGERIWTPEVPILESVKKDLTGLCRRKTEEQCGFISSSWEIVAVNNVHEEPTHNFWMDTADAQASINYIIEERQDDIIAVWHTHPNNWPWPTPRDICGWPDRDVVDWRYFVVTGHDVIEWTLVRDT